MPTNASATIDRTALREATEDLVNEIVNGDDTHWTGYLERLAHERALGLRLGMYKTWSASNVFYLHAQARSRKASTKGLYAGVDQWRRRGRTVVETEKPFIIFGAPRYIPGQRQQSTTTAPTKAPAAQPKQAAANTQQVPAQTPAVPARGVFRTPPMLEVFDYTQTVAQDPDYVEPSWEVPLTGGDLATLNALVAASPVPVTFTDLGARNESGWLDATGITVDDSMPVGNRIFTLVHELAHFHLGHLEQVNATTEPAPGADEEEYATYARCEQEAALTQFLVMKTLGLDESVGLEVTKAAGAYLRSWMKRDKDGKEIAVSGHKTKRKLLTARFDQAMKAADKIVSVFAAPEPAPAS